MRKLEEYTPTRFMAETSHYDQYKADVAVTFIEYLKHTKGVWAGEPFELIDWQEQIIRDVFGIVKPNGYRQFNTAYIEIPKKQGKQLALDTKIPTPGGFSTMGDLQVGDTVFDENGHPCRVVAKSEVDDTEQAYRLTFRDGSSIVAGERHLWNVECISEDSIMTTGELYRSERRVRIPAARDLPFGEADGFHYLANIEPLYGKIPMQCIQVDSTSHCYLAGESFVPTHNSELAAAVAILLCCGDLEQRAEVYGCAADVKQASIVFDVAADMVSMCPNLAKRVKIRKSHRRMTYLPTNSFYQVLSAEAYSKHGLNVHGVVFDELHAQPNRELYDVMTKGSGDARTQPLYFLITTAGNNRNSICYEVHNKALDILEGRKADPTFYPVIYGAKDDDDWTSEEVWKKANPSLGITVQIDKVRDACESARQNPAEENTFRQLRLNQWVNQEVRWMPMEKWDACAFLVDEKALEGRVCYGGLDLSSTNDITAFVLVFPPVDDDDKYQILPYFWLPEEAVPLRTKRDHVPYDVWARQELVCTTEGAVIHYSFVEQFIAELGERFNIREIAFDRWGATQVSQDLDEMGFQMVQFGQGYASMSPPTKELMNLTLEQRIAHGGNPVLRWMMNNIFIEQDASGNIKMSKRKSTEKIDGAVAMVMALDRAIRVGNVDSSSVYDSRGLLVF